MNIEEEIKNGGFNTVSIYNEEFKFPENETMPESINYEFKLEKQKSHIEELAEDVYSRISDDLELNREYQGIIKNIYYTHETYDNLCIVYELDDNGISKTAVDTYTFGGSYDEWYMSQLITYIKKIDNLEKNDINWYSTSSIAESLQGLIGARVTLSQYLTQKQTRKNKVTVHDSYKKKAKEIEV